MPSSLLGVVRLLKKKFSRRKAAPSSLYDFMRVFHLTRDQFHGEEWDVLCFLFENQNATYADAAREVTRRTKEGADDVIRGMIDRPFKRRLRVCEEAGCNNRVDVEEDGSPRRQCLGHKIRPGELERERSGG